MGESPTNRQLSEQDAHFRAMCVKASVLPTRRQASKFRRHTGSAWRAHLATQHDSKDKV